MKIGDIVEVNSGERGVVVKVEKMYPRHPQSPVGQIAVEWIGNAPKWWRRGLMFDTFSVNRVVSRAQ